MEREDQIKELIDEIETARIFSGALFEQFANEKEYDKAVIFQMVRDTLREQKTALEQLIIVNKETEKS